MRQKLRRRRRCECRRGNRVVAQRRHRLVVEDLEQRHGCTNPQVIRPLGRLETMIAASESRASILRKQPDFELYANFGVGSGSHGSVLTRLYLESGRLLQTTTSRSGRGNDGKRQAGSNQRTCAEARVASGAQPGQTVVLRSSSHCPFKHIPALRPSFP